MTLLPSIALCLATCSADPAMDLPLYVGESACLVCHDGRGVGAVCNAETAPKHGTSYKALGKPEAAEIAALSGVVGAPSENRICLACHATGADDGPRWWAATFRMEGGVQCEACHGPGSIHVAHRLAPPRPADVIRPSSEGIRPGKKEDCAICHVDRPSHREVLELGFRRESADLAYRTPVNLAISKDGERLYVICEHADSVIEVSTSTGTIVGEINVGQRPHDATLSPNGRRLYVTNRLSATVSVIDTESRRPIAEIPVGSEPHGILVDRSEKYLVVLNTGSDDISIIDTASLREVRRVAGGRGPWSLAAGGGTDLIATSVRPEPSRFRDPPISELTILDGALGRVRQRITVPGANMLQGIAWSSRDQVVLFTLLRTKNLVPTTRVAQGWVVTNGLGVLWPDGRVDQILLDTPNDFFPDPMDIALSPDGGKAIVTSGGADEVAMIDVARMLAAIREESDATRADVLPNHLGFSDRIGMKRILVGANPRGAVFSPGGRWVYVANALDDSVSVIDMTTDRVARTIGLGGPREWSEIRKGERLFHSAAATSARQFSCRTCHPDGHTNGLTFDIEADGAGLKPVDNRSLRGVFDTPPFKWEGTNPTLHRQCGPRFSVFFTRLAPPSPDELSALVRYMATIEQVPNRFHRSEGLTDAQRRGKAIFERSALNDGTPLALGQRCNDCHRGAYLTNRASSAVSTTMWFDAWVDVDLAELFNSAEFGELGSYYFMDAGLPSAVFDTPHLTNVADAPPFLHNGSAWTLEEIWTRFNMVNHHGATADLTRRQLNDLVAYIKAQ